MSIKAIPGIVITPRSKKDTDDLIKAIKKKTSSKSQKDNLSLLRSKNTSLEDKIEIIKQEVTKILGRYKKTTVTIYSKHDFMSYIDACIKNDLIVIDTETNNSLDPITCDIMGLCLYTPGQLQSYIPVNHTTLEGDRLENQLTEADIHDGLQKIIDANTKIVMHNSPFDYLVLKCTCDVDLTCYWDTMIGARLLDENESAKLKDLYRNLINPSQDKYNIEHLFKGLPYAIFDPELFALYAATDSFMTYKVYQYQLNEFERPGMEKLFNLFLTVEVPVAKVTADMELAGINIDTDYVSVLSKKYHDKLVVIENELDEELSKLKPTIDAWRLTDAANHHQQKVVKNKNGVNEVKYTKSLSEQLSDPVLITSPTQLAILFYDVLGAKSEIDKKTGKASRGTGEEELKGMEFPICKKILEKRELDKLIDTYIDKLPACIKEKTGRLHAHFNSLGADTGRMSSTDPNLQNIPSHNQEIRMMFSAENKIDTILAVDDSIVVNKFDKIKAIGYTNESTDYITALNLHVGDFIYVNDENDYEIMCTIKQIVPDGNSIKLYLTESEDDVPF